MFASIFWCKVDPHVMYSLEVTVQSRLKEWELSHMVLRVILTKIISYLKCKLFVIVLYMKEKECVFPFIYSITFISA